MICGLPGESIEKSGTECARMVEMEDLSQERRRTLGNPSSTKTKSKMRRKSMAKLGAAQSPLSLVLVCVIDSDRCMCAFGSVGRANGVKRRVYEHPTRR